MFPMWGAYFEIFFFMKMLRKERSKFIYSGSVPSIGDEQLFCTVTEINAPERAYVILFRKSKKIVKCCGRIYFSQ